jgi:hypothetical protein
MSLRRKLLRVLIVGLISAASFVTLTVIGVISIVWILASPSLGTLEGRFPNQRHDLETIVSMSDHDAQLTVIDPSWLSTMDHQFLGYSPDTGITRERWGQYRRLFSRNDITQGIRRDPDTKDAFIIVKSFGLLDRGTSAGYLYCGPGPNHSYPPCSSSQSSGDHPYKPGDEAYSFIKLAERWYAYSQGPS